MQYLMKAYVTHYTPLKERKSHVIAELAREGLTPVFIEAYDREDLSANDIRKFMNNGSIKLGSISLILKHFAAWETIVEKNEPYGIIFEDDVILVPGFKEKLTSYMAQLPSGFDILMINEGCNFHIPVSMQREGTFVYNRGTEPTSWGGNGGTRCTDGYIISNKCAKQFLTIYRSIPDFSIGLNIDWLMNVFMRVTKSNVYWAEPSIVKQGTETGLFQKSY